MFSGDDEIWLKNAHPSLKLVNNRTGIVGRLQIDMLYNESTNKYTLSPKDSAKLQPGVIYIVDDYMLEIEWPSGQAYPKCFEIDGKIEEVSKRRGVKLGGDMHINPTSNLMRTGDFCLAAPQEIELAFGKGFTLQIYIDKFVIPFLFLQSHYSKTGLWAWRTEGHGLAGVFSWYNSKYDQCDTEVAKKLTIQHAYRNMLVGIKRDELLARLLRGPYKGHMPCLCQFGAPHKIRNCCPEALYGLNRLRKEMINTLLGK